MIDPASGDPPGCKLDLVKMLGCDKSLYDRIVSSAGRPMSAGLMASTIL